MAKKELEKLFSPILYQLGKDIGEINRTLTLITSGTLPKTGDPQATQDSEQIRDINTVLEAVQQYGEYVKANSAIQQSFERFLSSNVQDYELTDEQRRTLYHSMCQHVWQINIDPQNPTEFVTLPIPAEFQGKFAYVVKPLNGYTEITYELLGESHFGQINAESVMDGNDMSFKPAYAYLVIPDLVAMREPQIVTAG